MPKILPDWTRDWTEEYNNAMASEDDERDKIRSFLVPLRKKLKYWEITQEEFDKEYKKFYMDLYDMDEERYKKWKES